MKNRFPKPLTIIICLIIFIGFSCQKNDGRGGDKPDDYSLSPPPPTPVNTDLAVYAYNNDQANNPLQLLTLGGTNQSAVDFKNIYDGFFAGPLTVDKYASHLAYRTTIVANDPGFWQYKSYNLSSVNKNYLGFKFLDFTNAGNVRNLGGPVTLNLPGNGTLAFPSEVFSSLGLEMNYNIYVYYLDPTKKDFAVSLPNLSFGDDNWIRWFLNSYGVYQIRPILSYCNCNVLSSEDLFAKEVTMQMPIPASRIAFAPDSIEAWHLDAHTLTWIKNGFAYKKNGFYEKKIRQYGVWNLAKAEDAAYVTLQLRTTNDIPLPNTRFVVKNNNDEIAEGRTDIEGNALVLVPVNATLTFNIIDDHFLNYLNIQLPDQSIGSFSKESTVKIVLPDRNDIGTLDGSVYKCDGSSFGNGSVVIIQNGARDEYVTPIVNGRFTTANWLKISFGDTKLIFRDANGTTAFEVNTYLGSEYISHLKRLKENFYACPSMSNLYCNLQIDKNAISSIQGDANNTSPTLIAKPLPGTTEITIKSGNNGISFSMWILGGPTGVISTGLPLTVNNAACRFNSNGSSELTIYRNDAQSNGFMEGWFAIDYLDAANNPHTASGNFRLKIF